MARRAPKAVLVAPVHQPQAPYMDPKLAEWNESMRALDASTFQPLVVRCALTSPLVSPERTIALDSLLAFAAVRRTGQLLASSAHECVPVEIPIERSRCGRFHLASFAQFNVEKRSASFTNKRFPIREAQSMSRMTRVQESTGACKGFRIPREHLHVENLEWYCIGVRERITELLCGVTSLGKKRGVGMGEIVTGSWRVEPIEPWNGFPVLRDGTPLRPLPLDWHGLHKYEESYCRITYPYWDRSREGLWATQPRAI